MILSIQYLRGISALLVVLSHIAWKNIQAGGSTMHWWNEAGVFGIDIFFIISGFIMIHITQNMHRKSYNVRKFIKNRFIRIIPLYWFYTTIALVIFIIIPERVNSSGGTTDILKSFFLLPLEQTETYLLAVGWTLRYEFIFYMIFSLGLLLSRKAGNTFVFSVLTISFLYAVLIPINNDSYIMNTLLSDVFIEFALGMFLYLLLKKFDNIHWLISALAIIIGIIQFNHIYTDILPENISRIDKGVTAFLICFGFISLESFWKKKEIKVLTILGAASYSIYLTHSLILVVVVMINDEFKYLIPQNEIFIATIMLLSSIIGGYISYIFIEKNLIIWVKNRLNKEYVLDTYNKCITYFS